MNRVKIRIEGAASAAPTGCEEARVTENDIWQRRTTGAAWQKITDEAEGLEYQQLSVYPWDCKVGRLESGFWYAEVVAPSGAIIASDIAATELAAKKSAVTLLIVRLSTWNGRAMGCLMELGEP
jgi:hypothetical protein